MPRPELNIVTATWKTPLSSDFWKKLEGLAIAATTDGDLYALGPVLPDESDSRVADAVVHRHEGELHWALTVQPPPSGEPPEYIKAHDEKLGGRRGLSSLLAEALPSGAPAVGSFRLHLSFPEAQFLCPMIPFAIKNGEGHDAALRLGRGARLEQVGYRFEGGGAGGIEEVALIYIHPENRYNVLVSAAGPLKLSSPMWLSFAEDVGELVQNTFFSPREAQS